MRTFPKKVWHQQREPRQTKGVKRGNVIEESVKYYSFKRLACSEVVLKDCLLAAYSNLQYCNIRQKKATNK